MSRFWSGVFGGHNLPHDRFSLAELERLHTIVLRNSVITDANRDTVVEALRSMSELVIWGDQHEEEASGMVEYFLTQNMLAHFTRILLQRSNRRGNVAMQVLQTLSILVQNVRNEQTIFYLFSNNHINEIVSMRFDFDDDEVLGYYVNLLKTISLKLNEVTVQFFFQSIPGQPASFPLYTEAIKFAHHRDGMVRTAVKTLTLCVYAIRLPALQRFVTEGPAATYFTQLAVYIAEQCQVLDRLLSSWDVTNPQSPAQVSDALQPAQVEACLAEIEDLLSYCNDVLASGVESLRTLLLDRLWAGFVGPVLFWPLIQEDVAVQNMASLSLWGLAPGGGSSGGSASSSRVLATGTASPSVAQGSVGPLCSLFVFERLLQAITDPQFTSLLVGALLGDAASSSVVTSSGFAAPSQRPHSPSASSSSAKASMPPNLMMQLQYTPTAYRGALLGMLRGHDMQLAAAAVRLLAALLSSTRVDEVLLEAVGLLPRRRKKQQQLLEALTADSGELVGGQTNSSAAGQQHQQTCAPSGEQQRQRKQEQQEAGRVSGGTPLVNGSLSSHPTAVGSSCSSSCEEEEWPAVAVSLLHTPDGNSVRLRLKPSQRERQQQQQQQQQQHRTGGMGQSPSSDGAGCGEARFQELTAVLVQLMASDTLPPVSLAVVGWLLHRLLSLGPTPPATASGIRTPVADLSPSYAATLEGAAAQLRSQLHQALQGIWCDALAPLIAGEWSRARGVILRSGAGSLHQAVYTWMQAVLVQELRWQPSTGDKGIVGGVASEAAAADAVAMPPPADPTAAAAKQAYLTVQALVAVVQVQSVLLCGDIPVQPPSPVVGDAELRAAQIREQSQISLSARMHCMVAFARGQERRVYFGVEGLPPNIKAEATDLSKLKPAALQLVAAAGPVVVVADAGSRPDTGLVLSTAPLMGADATLDSAHPKWLHISVRPPLRGLLKVVAASHPGNVLLNLQKHLVSGHWVLAFPDADRAASAAQHVEVWLHRMRVVYFQLLAPLLHPTNEASGEAQTTEA